MTDTDRQGLTEAEEERWLVDRERGGWQYATERILADRLAPLHAALAEIESRFVTEFQGVDDVARDNAYRYAVRTVRAALGGDR